MTRNVAFRVDVSNQIGSGHLMRCLTLANGLKKCGVQTRFVCRYLPEHMREMLKNGGHDIKILDRVPDSPVSDRLAHAHWLSVSQKQDAAETQDALYDQNWDWLVVDHYALDANWESSARKISKKLMVIDDIADRSHDCDLLLDQNFYADMHERYDEKVTPGCQLLLGPRFALLRDEFRLIRAQVTERSADVNRILVFFGGVDVDNYTQHVIEALASLDDRVRHVDVVIGAQHPYRVQIEAACAERQYVSHTQTNRMAELMAQADLAVGAGGSTTWERCFMGLPSLVISVAENQQDLVADAASEGLIYAPNIEGDLVPTISRHLIAILENTHLRQSMSRKGMQAIDGRGLQRVIRHMGLNDIEIRLAVAADSEKLFEWRNHPEIRRVSANPEPIKLEVHRKWLASVLSSADKLLLIGQHAGLPIGVVRFDIQAHTASISIYLVPGAVHTVSGGELLHAAESWLCANRPDVKKINALVLYENKRSQGLFTNAGYQVGSISYTKRPG